MTMKRVTIKDIANNLGLHHSTVSRALRFSSEVNVETRERVINYAQSKGYQINRNALLLRGVRSNIIGVIVPNIHHNFFSNFVSIVTRLAFEAGFIVAIFQSEESLVQEIEIVNSIIQQNLAGVIFSHSMETEEVSHFNKLEQYKIPIVCFDRVTKSLNKSAVVLNNEITLKNAIERLSAMGYSKIAYVSGASSIQLFRERQKGYISGLEDINSSFRNCVTLSGAFTIQKGHESIKEIWKNDEKPDALIFDSHLLAIGALNYLKKNHPKCTDNLGIASFGGDPCLSLYADNTIIIKQPEKQMAEAALKLLLSAIDNPTADKVEIIEFQAEIVDNKL